MNIVGLDLSLRATGFCHGDGTTETLSSKLSGMARIGALWEAILRRIVIAPDLIVIEDYAFSRGGHAHEIGELGGVVKYGLGQMGQRYVLVGPSSLKKFATGKGNANKIEMGVAAAKLGEEFGGDDNRCDAWWLYQMGCYRYTEFMVAVTAYRDDAVSKVAWPELGEKVCAG